jgi:hypothetical protein
LIADGACAERGHALLRKLDQVTGKEAPMRFPISSVIASIAVVLTAPTQATLAQQSSGESTIRLTSATEPARDSESNNPVQSNEPATEERQSAPPIQSSGEAVRQQAGPLAPPAAHMPVSSPAINRTRMPAGFYASPEARETLNQLPGPAPMQSASRLQTTRRGGKPFQAVQSQPTISPYLYLNAGTNNASPMTNYFAFVRPQMEQQEAGRQQQREIQQLRSQLQKVSTNGSGSQPKNTSTAAHYMDTGQFYRGLPR